MHREAGALGAQDTQFPFERRHGAEGRGPGVGSRSQALEPERRRGRMYMHHVTVPLLSLHHPWHHTMHLHHPYCTDHPYHTKLPTGTMPPLGSFRARPRPPRWYCPLPAPAMLPTIVWPMPSHMPTPYTHPIYPIYTPCTHVVRTVYSPHCIYYPLPTAYTSPSILYSR